jgi:hypothetical protein
MFAKSLRKNIRYEIEKWCQTLKEIRCQTTFFTIKVSD